MEKGKLFKLKEKDAEHELELRLDPVLSDGVYVNLAMFSHRKNEFIGDFFYVQPQRTLDPDGDARAAAPRVVSLRARIITTPEHMKRILAALYDNVQQYEKSFGKIPEEAEDAVH
jgi:hypothetical protein